ncbi:hypothetical protein PtrEW4_008361 [Pyrenophora tritici-repentis]|nr:hypothetical protein PtrSN001A_004589 [Pyrenophora tritici-repentis]KAI1565167.1 hypothetical protein PtrEW4_008361 [Pyrenophora tritici-repentis]
MADLITPNDTLGNDEGWRVEVVQMIATRQKLQKNHAGLHQTPPKANGPIDQALKLPEIIEAIIQQATPAVQAAAWNINHTWRDTVKIFMRPYQPHRSSPSMYRGQDIGAYKPYVTPLQAEIAQIERVAPTLSQLAEVDSDKFFFPATIMQSPLLSQEVFDTINISHERCFRRDYGHRTYRKRQWLDLSQFEFNPYLL